MRNTWPISNMIVLFVLALFLSIDSSAVMARGGGGGGGGGGGAGGGGIGGGGGYGGARGGAVRSQPPGNYRMRRVYSPYRHGTEGNVRSQPTPQTQMQPAGPGSQRTDMNSSPSGSNPFVSPKGSQVPYRSINEKYEKLRETRHQEYWEKRKNLE